MKKTQDIIGLPVFSVLEGRKGGEIKELVINPDTGKVNYLLVSNDRWYWGARVLVYESVLGVGEHAVTTESDSHLKLLADVAEARTLLLRNIEVKGSRLLTDQGDLIGTINEYEFDEKSGSIVKLYYQPVREETGVLEIGADNVLTYGAEVIVIKGMAAGSPITPLADQPNDVSPKPAETEADGAALFKKRQREYLIGKKAQRDLTNDNGEIIVTEGTIITEEVIALAEQYKKFIELSQVVK